MSRWPTNIFTAVRSGSQYVQSKIACSAMSHGPRVLVLGSTCTCLNRKSSHSSPQVRKNPTCPGRIVVHLLDRMLRFALRTFAFYSVLSRSTRLFLTLFRSSAKRSPERGIRLPQPWWCDRLVTLRNAIFWAWHKVSADHVLGCFLPM